MPPPDDATEVFLLEHPLLDTRNKKRGDDESDSGEDEGAEAHEPIVGELRTAIAPRCLRTWAHVLAVP